MTDHHGFKDCLESGDAPCTTVYAGPWQPKWGARLTNTNDSPEQKCN